MSQAFDTLPPSVEPMLAQKVIPKCQQLAPQLTDTPPISGTHISYLPHAMASRHLQGQQPVPACSGWACAERCSPATCPASPAGCRLETGGRTFCLAACRSGCLPTHCWPADSTHQLQHVPIGRPQGLHTTGSLQAQAGQRQVINAVVLRPSSRSQLYDDVRKYG